MRRLDFAAAFAAAVLAITPAVAGDSTALSPAERAAKIAAIKAEIAKLDAENCTGGVEIRPGITLAEAIRAWCYPDSYSETKTAAGTDRTLVYRARGAVVSMHNGRVVQIETRH